VGSIGNVKHTPKLRFLCQSALRKRNSEASPHHVDGKILAKGRDPEADIGLKPGDWSASMEPPD
jgi:hypothetical protein